MLTFRTVCPLCLTSVNDWTARWPKCHYHPDHYNRAQDDVALIARYRTPHHHESPAGAADASTWRRFLPAWLGGS